MTDGIVTPWNVLSNAISMKVRQSRARSQTMKDQQIQTEYKAWDGILQNPNSTEEERNQALESMKKLVPKDTIPVVEAYHKVLDLARRKQQGMQGQGGKGQQGQQPVQKAPAGLTAALPASQSGPGGPSPASSSTPAPAASNAQSQPQSQAQSQPQPVPPNMSLPGVLAAQAARERGTAAAEEQVARQDVLRKDSMKAAEETLDALEAKGHKIPEELREEILTQAGGFKTTAHTFPQRKMQRVVVRDPNDPTKRIPALQSMNGWDQGTVYGPDGEEIDSPEVISSAAIKPKQGWQKVGGKIIGVMLDPMTGQIIPGTENPNILPPAQYLEKIQEGYIGFTDENNNFILVPKQTRTHPIVPDTGGGRTPVPPGVAGPAPTQAKGKGKKEEPTHGVARVDAPESAGKHLPPGSIVVGTKRASGQTLSRADAGRSIKPLIERARQLLDEPVDPNEPDGPKVRDRIGVLAGRWDKIEQKLGNLPGNLRELAGTLVSIYSLGGSMHGWRSSAVAEKFAATYGGLTSNPDSLLGGLRAMEGTADTVEKIAYPHHMDSKSKQEEEENKFLDQLLISK
jgi:hypothetical protein